MFNHDPAMSNLPSEHHRPRFKLHPGRTPIELLGLIILLLFVALGIGVRLMLLGGVGVG